MPFPIRDRVVQALGVACLLAFLWTLLLVLTGGFRLDWGPIRISSRTPDTPFLVGLAALGLLLVVLLRKSLARPPAPGAPEMAAAIRGAPWRLTVARLARIAIVAGRPVWYFIGAFDLTSGLFLKSGLETWLDAYFINYLQEHWLTSLRRFANPASPPMYYPVEGTLGYSHGLVLFAPIYVAARTVFDPFAADTVALFVVVVGGSIALAAAFRVVARLSFLESVLLAAFFFTNANIVNIGTVQWTQRASVFFIPAIVLLGACALRADPGRRRVAAAAATGLLAALLLTQDAYTAILAGFFVLLLGLPLFAAPSGRRAYARLAELARTPAGLAFLLGSYVGLLVFLWCYLPSLREHHTFPADHVTKALLPRDLSSWDSAADAWRSLQAYDTPRTFYLAVAIAAAAWLPGSGLRIPIRAFTLWWLAVSLLTILVPFSFSGFSLWQSLIAPIPGLAVIRDPKRIVYLYELATVGLAAWYLSRLPARSPARWIIVGAAGLLLATDWNPNTLRYRRSVKAFESWVTAPIAIDPACRSFFMTRASADYMGRSDDMWGLYNIDAMFIASRTGIPTLNGYSAWQPPHWGLARPTEDTYLAAVDDWIRLHRLEDVCALDIDARTMTRYTPASPPPEPPPTQEADGPKAERRPQSGPSVNVRGPRIGRRRVRVPGVHPSGLDDGSPGFPEISFRLKAVLLGRGAGLETVGTPDAARRPINDPRVQTIALDQVGRIGDFHRRARAPRVFRRDLERPRGIHRLVACQCA